MKVIPLGTSSGRPTLSRGLSAVAVQLDGPLVLFDCGEGTQWQLLRAGLRPTSKLEVVCITHLHGDHLTGLPGILGTMTLESRSAPIDLIGPPGLAEYLEQMKRLGLVRPQYALRVKELQEPGLCFEGSGYRIHADLLSHRLRAFGFRLEEHDRPGRFDAQKATALGVQGPERGELIRGKPVTLSDGRVVTPAEVVGPPRRGLRIAYCTDTIPCEGSVRLGRETDLMIHEATFTQEKAEEARERGHSTAAEAALQGKLAGTARLVLTHFSPRYDDLAPLLAEALAVYPRCELAQELTPIELTPPG
jgi:ribonuclease Z